MVEVGSAKVGEDSGGGVLHRPWPVALQRPGAVEFVAVMLAALAVTGLLALRTDLLSPGNPAFEEPGWDHHAYIAMAEGNPFDFHLAPFGWRILVPALAALLPFSTSASFFLIAFASVMGAAVAMYYLGRHAGGHRLYGAFGALLFLALGWAAKFALTDYWLPDAAAFLALSLAFLCIVKRRPALFAVTLLVGVAAKEAVIFVVPLWYTLQVRQWVDWKLLRETTLLALPAVALLIAVRLLIPAHNGDLEYARQLPANLQQFREFIPSYNYFDLLRDIGWDIRAHDRTADTFLLYTTGTWGVPILALAAIGAVRKPLLAMRLAPFMILVYAQLLFALNIERLLVYGFPAMIWLAIEGMRAVLDDSRTIRMIPALVLGAALVALNFRHPAAIPVGFELQTMLFIAFLAAVVGARPWRPVAGRI